MNLAHWTGMYFQKRRGRYSFIYYDTTLRKNVRLARHSTPSMETDAEALAFCKAWNSKYDAMKWRTKKRLEWMDKYINFVDLLKDFERARLEEAPLSWKKDEVLLRYYIFPYFLSEKNEANPNCWCYHFEEFRKHLETIPPMKRKSAQGLLSYSTINAILKTLNAFMTMLYRKRLTDRHEKARVFSESKCRSKDEQNVLSGIEQTAIYEALHMKHSLCADMFFIGLQTGLRINELVGLSLADFSVASQNDLASTMDLCLEPHQLKALAYLCLESQPSLLAIRNHRLEVPRKPLKGRKKISFRDARTIPILHPQAYEILARHWNKQRELFITRRYGHDSKNYLLFEGTTRNVFAHQLRQVQKTLQFKKFFSPHDMRHTYSTWLAEKTGGNFSLCKLILGHGDLEMTLRYVHMAARIRHHMKSQVQFSSPISLIYNDSLPILPN